MNYKEFLYDKDKVLSFYPELAVIFNKYDDMEIERIKREEEEAEEKGIVLEKKEKRPDKNGLGKAIVLNQLNYWLNLNEKTHHNYKDGYYWLYFSYSNWIKEDFKFWSVKTLQRILTSLENCGVVVSTSEYNRWKIDNTKWYRINYERLQEIIDMVYENERTSGQLDQMVESECPDGQANLTLPLPEITNKDYITKNTNNKNTFYKYNNITDVMEQNGYKEDLEKYNNKTDYTDKQLVSYITHTIDTIMMNEYGISGDKKPCLELKKIILYFYQEYNEIFIEKHPILSEISYGNIVDRYMNPFGKNMSEYDVKDFDTYKEMIDRYFQTDFGRYKVTSGFSNYGISHFMSEDVRENLYMEIV